MGGAAFASGPNALYTPRMPPAVYRQVRDLFQSRLRQLFVCVASPIEGPAKADYGDIDILVALERSLVFPSSDSAYLGEEGAPFDAYTAIGQVLGAERHIINKNSSCNYAVPWPEDAVDAEGRRRYVQVDVRVCDSIPQLQWQLFKHAHGDIWNLLGSTIRPFGLTIDEEALWIRVPEIERANRKRAKIFLSNDPSMVLQFLGLRQEGYWEEPFESVDALFEYVATCRLFWVRPEGVAYEPSEESLDGAEAAGVAQDKAAFKANDRQRMRQREVFRRWVDEFLPKCRATGRYVQTDPMMTTERVRSIVRDEAFALFGLARWFYQKRWAEWRKEKQAEEVWRSAIKESVPEDLDPQHRGVLVSALKKIIMQDDESYGFHAEADHAWKTNDGYYLIEDIRQWVLGHWREVEDVAWQRQLERAREGMMLRDAKRQIIELHTYERGSSTLPVS